MNKLLLILFCLLTLTTLSSAEEKPITYEYPEVGVSLLTPGGFNVMAGYSMNDITVRALGMYVGKTYGFQD